MKHWQLFILLFAIPLAFQMVMMAIVITAADLFIMQYLFPILMVLYLAAYFGWMYAVGIHIQGKLPSSVVMPIKTFKIFLVFPLVYMVAISILLFRTFGDPSFFEEEPVALATGILLIIPFHLFSMFCIFYCIWFVAKSLKAAELQRQVTFSDYVGEFMLFWFFVVGVWFLQPRINKMFGNSTENEPVYER